MSLNDDTSSSGQAQSSLDESFLRMEASPSSAFMPSSAPSSNNGGCGDCCCGCCRSMCRFCPCDEITKSLGIQAVDGKDSLRVYLRFFSLCTLICAAFYFMLLFGFLSWFDFAGAVALLALTFTIQFLLGAIGMYASIPPHAEGNASVAVGAIVPPRPWAVFLAKWISLVPLSLLCFFFSVWLGSAMLGLIDTDTNLTLASRKQAFSVLILGGTSLLALLLQCATFLVTTAWQQGDQQEDEVADAEWMQQQEAHRMGRTDTIDSSADER